MSEWEQAFILEMNVADVISKQSKHGVNFNRRQAQWNIHLLTEKIVNIDSELIPLLPPMLNKGSTYNRPFTVAGKLQKWPQIYCDRVGLTREEIGGPFTAVWYTPFDTSKSAKVKDVMLDSGWVPTEWNTKHNGLKIWSYRKRLEKAGFEKFMATCNDHDKAIYRQALNDFYSNNIAGKSENRRKAVYSYFGFDPDGKEPSIAKLGKKMLLTQKWPSSPRITEDSFDSINESDSRMLTLLKERMVWSHRRSLIKGLVEQIREDGKLEGQANSCATPTARMRHRVVVNIPAAGATFGKECRSLFEGDFDKSVSKPTFIRKAIADEFKIPNTNTYFEMDGDKKVIHKLVDYIPAGQHVIVGYDGAGLELRMLCHYMIQECMDMKEEALAEGDVEKLTRAEAGLKSALVYRDVLLHGDIHTHNQKLAGLPTRKAAKSFIYGFNYGAGDAKLGQLVNGGKEEGAKIRETFLRENPCIAILIERMQQKGQSGWLRGLDGRQLFLREDDDGNPQVHKALNLLLQSAGAIVMKFAMLFLRKGVRKHELRAWKVLDIHDEGQWSCHPDDYPALQELMDNCVRKAGEYLNMQCPLASDSIVGSSWYMTH